LPDWGSDCLACGLGTACHGLTKGLDEIDVEVSFVLPQSVPLDTSSHVAIRCPDSLAFLNNVETPANPVTPSTPAMPAKPVKPTGRAGKNTPAKKARTVKIDEEVFRHVSIHTLPALVQAYGTGKTFRQELTSLMAKARMGELTEELSKIVAQAAQFIDDNDCDSDIDASGEESNPARKALDPNEFKSDSDHYDGDLIGQIHRYARLAVELSQQEDFDVIHAHDWMTFPAGQAVAAQSGKPLVVQVHSTEFDRSGENVNQLVYDIERAGMHAATRVICVSYLTRSIAISRYGLDPAKADVVYNAVDLELNQQQMKPITHKEKIVLFLGRVTMQKGPEYFLQAARMVVDKFPNVRFVMAGSGDMVR